MIQSELFQDLDNSEQDMVNTKKCDYYAKKQ